MQFRYHSHRYGYEIFNTQQQFRILWDEIINIISNLTDQEIIEYFQNQRRRAKSISDAINHILDERFVALGWNRQSPIFNENEYRIRRESRWTLDFAKSDLSIEVAFNHGEAVAWNLIKPVLASELNHVEKAVQTKGGII